MKKLQLLSVALLWISLVQANPKDGFRGSIIIQDNQTVAYYTEEGKRVFPFHSTLSPVLGYVPSDTEGKRCVEQVAEEYLSLGYDVYININLKLQQKIESILDKAKIKVDAEHVIAAVMESKTGKVLVMASSNRDDPMHITQNDIPSLNQKFTEYPYEPGTVMSPFALAIALEHNVVTTDTVFNAYNGRMEYAEGKYIKDIQKYDALSAANIIIDFSHIGMIQISWLLSGSEFRDGLTKFGFGQPSGIEFYRDFQGTLSPQYRFEDKIVKASNSLGYGMLATFTQLLKAYNVFNNGGISVNPTIINNIQNQEKDYLTQINEKRIVSKKASDLIHNILVVNHTKEIEVKTRYANFEVGGKKSTAQIFKDGEYKKEYHSSFYGFANDDEHKYTIGVLVIRPKDVKGRTGSQSATLLFERVVEIMMEEHISTSHL